MLLSPGVYCVHVRTTVVLCWLMKHHGKKPAGPTGCCRGLDDPSRWFSGDPPS